MGEARRNARYGRAAQEMSPNGNLPRREPIARSVPRKLQRIVEPACKAIPASPLGRSLPNVRSNFRVPLMVLRPDQYLFALGVQRIRSRFHKAMLVALGASHVHRTESSKGSTQYGSARDIVRFVATSSIAVLRRHVDSYYEHLRARASNLLPLSQRVRIRRMWHLLCSLPTPTGHTIWRP